MGTAPTPTGLVTDPTTGAQNQIDVTALSTHCADMSLRDARWSYDGRLYATLSSSVCNPKAARSR